MSDSHKFATVAIFRGAPKPKVAPQVPPADEHAIILKARVRELERENKKLAAEAASWQDMAKSRERALKSACECEELCKEDRPVLSRSQYRNLQFCLHPDRVASWRNDELTARYTKAFRWLADFEGHLVSG
jgi:hypothetical protein